jgi:hypothetical protein
VVASRILVDVDGRFVVVVAPEASAKLAELLDRAHRQHVTRGNLPIAEADQLVGDLRTAAALDALDVVAALGHSARHDEAPREMVLSVTEVAVLTGRPQRTIRRWCIAERFAGARRDGWGWAIPAAAAAAEVAANQKGSA